MSEPTIGQLLRHLLGQAGETPETVAEKLGKSRQAIGRLVVDSANPQWSTITEVLAVIGATPYDLGVAHATLKGGEPPPYPRAWASSAPHGSIDRGLIEQMREHARDTERLADRLEQQTLADGAEG